MASTPKQANGKLPSNNNGSGGKRKKSRGSRGSYLSKWLDRTMSHIQESTPSSEMYDTFMSPMIRDTNWAGGSQFAPGFDPYKYSMYASEPLSLPAMPTYYNPMIPPYTEYRYVQNENKGIQVQRPRHRRRSDNKAEEVSSTPADNASLSQNNYLQPKNFTDSQDYTSLPPIVTSMADTNSNSDMQNDKEDGHSPGNTRRFSDPCVRGLPDIARPANGDVDTGSESGSGMSGSQVGGRLLVCLLDQISTLKMANERLNKDLQEMRAELEAVRQNTYYAKGANNMGAAPNLNGISGQYSPGFLTDLVREIRDAARMREDAMYSRLRAMVLERTDNGLSSAETKLAERTLDEVKSSLRASEADKRRMMDRILKLEDELREFRLAAGFEPNESRLNGSVEDVECDRLRLRKELADVRRAKINAEEHALKLERLVTQLRSKFNGLQVSNGPDSLPSDNDHDARPRRPANNSANSSTSNLANFPGANVTNNLANFSGGNATNTSANSTVVFGPVTDL